MKKLIFALSLLILFPLVSATFSYTNYTAKWEMCNALNYTSTACDKWWESASDFNISSQVNVNNNLTLNDSYYTKAEMNAILSNISNDTLAVYGTISNLTTIVIGVKNLALDVNDSINNGNINQNQQQNNTQDNTPFYLVIGALVVVIAVVLLNKKKQVPQRQQSFDGNEGVAKAAEDLVKSLNKTANKSETK
jgi:hypothetical protein